MAVVTPEGIVGKVVAVYPLVSQVLLVTDPTFKVGVESQKDHVHGVLDCGSGKCADPADSKRRKSRRRRVVFHLRRRPDLPQRVSRRNRRDLAAGTGNEGSSS